MQHEGIYHSSNQQSLNKKVKLEPATPMCTLPIYLTLNTYDLIKPVKFNCFTFVELIIRTFLYLILNNNSSWHIITHSNCHSYETSRNR